MRKSWNASVWAGLVLVLAGVASYALLFIRYAATRDNPWASLLIVAIGLVLLAVGIARAFGRPDAYRGRIFGSILGALSLALAVFFCWGVLYGTRLPVSSHGAPQLGQVAPDFTLPDSQNTPVNLSGMLNSSFAPNGAVGPAMSGEKTAAVLLIFYRGYW